MLNTDEGGIGINHSASLLSKIAEALDCSIEDLSSTSSSDLGQTIELFQLWLKIIHDQDRKKVLSFV